MPMKHESAFHRVHRAIHAVYGVRQSIVEDHEAIEARLYCLIKSPSCIGLCQVASERIILTQDQGSATYGAPFIFRQRIHVRKPAVAGIIVPSLAAPANI